MRGLKQSLAHRDRQTAEAKAPGVPRTQTHTSHQNRDSMEPRAGFPLLRQQFRALFKKNFMLAWRSWRSTFLFLFSSLVFILLLFFIQNAIEARFSSTTVYENVFDPKPLVISAIPPCEDKFYSKQPCFDFVWSGNGSEVVSRIVQGIMDRNPGRRINSAKNKGRSRRMAFGPPKAVPRSSAFPRNPNFSWVISFEEFAHPAMTTFPHYPGQDQLSSLQ